MAVCSSAASPATFSLIAFLMAEGMSSLIPCNILSFQKAKLLYLDLEFFNTSWVLTGLRGFATTLLLLLCFPPRHPLVLAVVWGEFMLWSHSSRPRIWIKAGLGDLRGLVQRLWVHDFNLSEGEQGTNAAHPAAEGVGTGWERLALLQLQKEGLCLMQSMGLTLSNPS